jgi:hypothetical protein
LAAPADNAASANSSVKVVARTCRAPSDCSVDDDERNRTLGPPCQNMRPDSRSIRADSPVEVGRVILGEEVVSVVLVVVPSSPSLVSSAAARRGFSLANACDISYF